LNDPALRRVRVGVHVVSDDASNLPPAQALANRGIFRNVASYSMYGDASQPNPPAALIDAVSHGDVDLAIAWGPLAGYFARRAPAALEIVQVSPQVDRPFLPFTFSISMGVRPGDTQLLRQLNGVVTRRGAEIRAILQRYGVPMLEQPWGLDMRLAILAAILLCAFLAAGCSGPATEVAAQGAAPPIGIPVGPVPGAPVQTNPRNSPYGQDQAALAEGRRLFQSYNCAGCHGDHAGGGMGPSLRDEDWIYGGSDAQVFNSIAEGRAHGMPAWGIKVPEDQIWKLVAYIKSLRTSSEPEAPV
jgi:mono/diheme cytochrome c family protein